MADADVHEGDLVLEVGAGLGSLTVPLAEAGFRVLAVEVDRGLANALREVVAPYPNVRIEVADAMRLDWPSMLGAGRWSMVSNLPYNVSVPLVLELLETAPAIDRYVVMVQREVGDRLVAGPGAEGYGAVSVRVAYHADARVMRRVPADVFWPRQKIDSVLVRLEPRAPAVDVDRVALFAAGSVGTRPAPRRSSGRSVWTRARAPNAWGSTGSLGSPRPCSNGAGGREREDDPTPGARQDQPVPPRPRGP